MHSRITAAMLFGAVAALPATAMAQGTQIQGVGSPAVRTDDRTAGAPVPGEGNVFAGGRAITGAGAIQGDTASSRDETPGDPPGTAAGRAVDSTLGTNASGANPGAGRTDGTAGNPPSTAAGRAVDRAQGQTPQPDGTPANPSGTAAGRTVDRALGTNATGANPAGSSVPAR